MSNFISSEVYLYNIVIKNVDDNTVNYHGYYWFDDTSRNGVGKHKNVPVTFLYQTEALPYDLTVGGYLGSVDWCNFTIIHSSNIYSYTIISTPEYLNTTDYIYSYYFDNGSVSDEITINMRDKDNLVVDMICHYTDNSSVYVENTLFGRYTTFMPSFECDGCEEYSLEQLSNMAEQVEQTTQNELAIYDKIQTAVGWNYQVWLILSWVVKIGFVLLEVILIFAVGYYFYKLLSDLARE
jgi:hypothetical protein